MSQINKIFACPGCGEVNDPEAKFCAACGASLSIGKRHSEPLAPVVADAASADAPAWYRFLHKGAVYNGIVMFICLALILLVFAPFISVQTRTPAGGEYSTLFSPAELVHYALKSTASYDDAAILSTPEYRAHVKLSAKAASILSSARISAAREELLMKYNKSAIEVGLMRWNNSPSPALVAAALMTAAYVIIAFIGFITSLIAFILALSGRADASGRARRASRLLTFIAMCSPVYALVLVWACRFPYELVPGFGNVGAGLAWGLILAIILLSTVPIYSLVRCYASLTGFVGFKVATKNKMRMVAVLLLVLVVVAVFLPTFSVGFAMGAGRNAKEATQYVGIGEVRYLTYYDRAYYTSMYSANSELNLKVAAETAVKGKAGSDGIGTAVLHGVLNTYTDLSVLYMGAAVLATVLLFIVLSFIGKLARVIINGGRFDGVSKYIAPTIVMASLYLAMCIAISITANVLIGRAISRYILFGVGIGPLLALCSAIAAAIVLNLRCAARVEGGFDNPDTSKAPYVIGGN